MKKALILFIDIFNTGGVQQYNKRLCDIFASGFSESEFTGISLHDSREKADDHTWPNIGLKFCGRIKIKAIQKIVFIIKAVSTVIKENPDFLICAHVDLAPLALFLKKIFNLRYSVLTYGTDVWCLKSGIKYQGLDNADIIITISEYTKNKLVANGIPESKIELLRAAIDTLSFYPKPPDIKLASGLHLEKKRILLTVGRIRSDERYKGHDIMLSVMRKLGDGYVWLVIGSGADIPRLKLKSKKLGVIERTKFLGTVPGSELVDYYNLCDCFIMPSKGEGFGIVFLEALACGKPVIGGNKDGSPEPLINGRLGFMADPDSVDDIIKSVNLVFKAEDRRTDSQYLREEVEANFGIKVFNRRARDIFAKYLS